jgi:hypothetical protein
VPSKDEKKEKEKEKDKASEQKDDSVGLRSVPSEPDSLLTRKTAKEPPKAELKLITLVG